LKDRICTIEEIAEAIFSVHLSNLRLISDEESKIIISQILSKNKQSLSLFTDDRRISFKFIQGLKRFISTLIQRKIDYPGCLACLQSEKSKQLMYIYSNYLKFLSDNHVVDGDLLLSEVSQYLLKDNNIKIKRVFLYGFFEPSPLEKEFIVTLGKCSTIFHYEMPFADNSNVFVDRGEWLPTTQRVLNKSDKDGAKLSQLFSGTEVFNLSDKMLFSKFKDRVSEIRALAQEICNLAENGVDPASIAVVLPDRDRAAGLISYVFNDFKIPYDIRNSSMLAHATIVQAIIGIIEIPAYNYRRESVVKLVKSPYIRIPSKNDGMGGLLGHEVDFESRNANVIMGRDDWKKINKSLNGLQDRSQAHDICMSERLSLNDRINRIIGIDAGLGNLFDCLHKLDGDKGIRQHIKALRQSFYDLNFGLCAQYPNPESRQRDAKALKSFFEVLDHIEQASYAIPDEKMGLKDFLSILSVCLYETRYDETDANINAVQVTGMREVANLSFDYVFIPDLVDGEIPKISQTQPFFTGFELDKMDFLTKKDILRRERYYFLSAILTSKLKLFLSCSSTDQDQPLIPSSFVRDLSEFYNMGSWGDGEMRCSTIKQQFDDGKRISLRDCKRTELASISQADAHLIAGRINIENYYRKNNYNSEYDGILKSDTAIVLELSSRFNDSMIYSPTMFESYGLCPFHFYLKYVLHLRAMSEVELKISSKDLGGLFHRIAFRFYANRKKEGIRNVTMEDLPNAIEAIKKIAQDEFKAYSFDDDPVWSSLKQRIVGISGGRTGILEAFVKQEAKGLPSCFSPANFELSIGRTASMDLSDACSRVDPVSLDLGSGEPSRVLMQGRIDRLDVTEDGQFMVIDYKTGAINPSHKDIVSGISFQLPLYIRCIETCYPGMQGIAGAYYIIKSDGDISKKVVLGDKKYIDIFESLSRSHGIKDDYQEILSSSLRTVKKYIQDMRNGVFHPTVFAGKCPRYCDYKTICRFNDLRLLESSEMS